MEASGGSPMLLRRVTKCQCMICMIAKWFTYRYSLAEIPLDGLHGAAI